MSLYILFYIYYGRTGFGPVFIYLLLKIFRISLIEIESNPNRVKNQRETSIFLWDTLIKIRPRLLPAFDKNFVQWLAEILVSPLDYSPDSDSIRFWFRFSLSVRSLLLAITVCLGVKMIFSKNLQTRTVNLNICKTGISYIFKTRFQTTSNKYISYIYNDKSWTRSISSLKKTILLIHCWYLYHRFQAKWWTIIFSTNNSF